VCVDAVRLGDVNRARRRRAAHRRIGWDHPAERVHPEVVEVMREIGVDLSGRRPALLTPELAERADVVVTMGCGDSCSYVPGKRYVDWDLPDPNGRPIDAVRALREDIGRRVAGLLDDLDQVGSTG
jgi:arsenate reductase